MFKFWNKKGICCKVLYPLSLVYGVVSAINIRLRSKNSYKAKACTISIGNINIGGTGKTPLTVAIANYLGDKGYKVAIIGHSYKATIEHSKFVDYADDVALVGDEAKQMSMLLNDNVKLIVGKNRIDSVKLAESKNADIILLDDGYSATYIQRDLNIVVIDGKMQLANQCVLPAGPLREPVSGLKRSDCLVIINRYKSLNFEYLKDIFYLRSKISFSEKLKTKSLMAFCGLGMPEKFYNSLNKEGLSVKITKNFPDHYKYTNQDFESLINMAKKNNLQLVTTLKDYVKVPQKYKNSIEVVMLDIELTKVFADFLIQKVSKG